MLDRIGLLGRDRPALSRAARDGADAELARSSLRFSLGHTSTRDDVAELLDAIGPSTERSRRAGALVGRAQPAR